MIDHETTWSEVKEGHTIRDKNGKLWYVYICAGFDAATDKIYWWLEDMDGVEVKVPAPPDDRPVSIVIMTTKEILEHRLGAKEVSS